MISITSSGTSYFQLVLIMLVAIISSNNLIAKDISGQDTIPVSMIKEEKFININGIEQWVTIKGNSLKPAILFIHGGPGSPFSPYSDNLYKGWETDFLLIHWDQRGSGKTYGRNAPEELTPEYLRENPLSVEQMTADGIALTQYLLKHLGKQKIILFGTSWGSVLTVKMATKHPELYYAYVGHSQVVNPSFDYELYSKMISMAEAANDESSLNILNTISPPPYKSARMIGQLLRVIKKYESINSTPAPEAWFVVSPAYSSEQDIQHRSDGDDYSFVNYTGDSALEVNSMSAGINLMKDNFQFSIPVHLIQGEQDILTPKEKTTAYFNKIEAPEKKYYLLPASAHGFNEAVVETQYGIFKGIKTN